VHPCHPDRAFEEGEAVGGRGDCPGDRLPAAVPGEPRGYFLASRDRCQEALGQLILRGDPCGGLEIIDVLKSR
jgi:hypothetical protein